MARSESKFWQLIFGSPDKPLLWSVVAYLVLAVALAIAVAVAAGQTDLAPYVVAPAAVTVVTAAVHRDRYRQVRAVSFGALAAILGGLGLAASVSPFLAGISAAIVFAAITAMKAAPEWSIESDLLSLAYFLGVLVSLLAVRESGLAISAMLVGAVGAVCGLAGELLRLLVFKARGVGSPATGEMAGRPLRERIALMRDLKLPVVRFAIVRGISLGIGAAVLANSGPYSRHVAWVMVAIFAVMRPVPGDTLSVAVTRIAATFVGVLVIGIAAEAVDYTVVIVLGVAGLLVGLLYALRSSVLMSVGSAMVAVAIAGAPQGQFAQWGFYRLIETVIGGAIALAVIFLVMPTLDRIWPVNDSASG